MLMTPRSAIGATFFATALALAGCGSMSMMKASSATNPLTGAQQVPPVTGTGSGTAVTTLDKSTRMLRWTITYSGLKAPVTAGHFHGPASSGTNAGVVVPFTGSMASPIEGSATLTEAQMADLLAGKWYANLHTSAHPGGEIRGQINGL